MAACQHRPEDACSFTPCARFEGGVRSTCICGEEVLAEVKAATVVETRVARVPDSARAHDFAVHLPGERDDCQGCIEGQESL